MGLISHLALLLFIQVPQNAAPLVNMSLDIHLTFKFSTVDDANAFQSWCEESGYMARQVRLDSSAHFCEACISDDQVSSFHDLWGIFLVSFGVRPI